MDDRGSCERHAFRNASESVASWQVVVALLVLAAAVASVRLPATADAPPPAPPLSLGEIIHTALKHNPQVAAARYDVDTALRNVDVNRGQSLPVLSITGDYEYLPRRAIIGPLVMTPQIMVPTYTGGVVGLGLSIPLYTGGRIPLHVHVSDLGVLTAQHRLDATEQDLIFNLSSLYYSTLRLDAAVRATKKSAQSLESARAVVSEFFTVGKEPRVDVLRVEARLADVSAQLVGLENARAVTLESVATLMGFAADTPIDVAGVDDALATALPEQLDIPSLFAQALQRRPEYLAMLSEERAQEDRVQLARAAYRPNVSFTAEYGVQSAGDIPSGGSVNEGVGQVMLSTRFPIFDQTVHEHIRQEESALAATRSRLAQTRLSVELDVQKAAVAVRDTAAQVSAAEAGLAQADEALRIEHLKLKVGKGVITDVLQAQADSLQAQLGYQAALASHRIALVQLQRASGALEPPQAPHVPASRPARDL
ncbi:TolC family protein [bacterium]|nr:MAG: TolC family protein [bacterium]